MNNMDAENLAEASSKSQLREKNKEETENFAKESSKAQKFKKRTHKSLRARSEALKKYAASNPLKAKKAKGNLEGKGRRKNKNALKGRRENTKDECEDEKNQNSMEKNIQKSSGKEKHAVKDQEIEKNQNIGSKKVQQNKKHKETHGSPSKSLRNQKNKGKIDGREKIQRDEKKEKLGGLIFMCNAKTKPDCFRYRVMGVTMNKKDLVLRLKPGLKLFLYDFDLKLMYGIYQATSSGGVKLEPKAFGGAFPVQVRFSIYKDCLPITEHVFKKAIKDNYNDKNKFDTELTFRQVRKLSELFKPIVFHSVPARSPPLATIRGREARESRVHYDREGFANINYDGRSYPVRSHERGQHIEYQELYSTRGEDVRTDLFMSENDYRAYRLKGEKRKLTPPHLASTLDPYQRDRGRELRDTDPVYRDVAPAQREAVHADPLYLPRREYQPYTPTVRRELLPVAPPIVTTASSSATTALDPYTRDPYYTYPSGSSSVDAYLPPPRREEVSSISYYTDGRREPYSAEANYLFGRETAEADRLYSKYAADAPSRYNQLYPPHAALSETAPPPVSSRYSFAGSSLTYRYH